MVKKWALIGILLLTSCSVASIPPPSDCSATWQGVVSEELVQQVVNDLARFRENECAHAVIDLNSSGGSVVYGLEIVRRMREVERGGMVLEIRGGSIVASMATVILAAGTPGYRSIDRHSLVIIHGISMSMGCVSIVEPPVSEEDKVGNQIIWTLARVLSELTHRDVATTLDWLTCENTQVGSGVLLVNLGFADTVR